MKNTMLRLLIAVCCITASLPYHSYASHAAGGELTYQWISDSTYRFFFRFYRDCAGVPANATQDLCMSTQQNCYPPSIAATMTLWTGPLPGGGTNGGRTSTDCPGYITKCQSASSSITGYQEWWYSAMVTLPAKCNYWTFSTKVSSRNPQGNLMTLGDMHIEATLNNLMFEGNSSPYFFVPPLSYLPTNTSYMYSNGAIDPNYDSLVTELIIPQNGVSNFCWASSPAGLKAGLNLTNNPFPTGNSFSLNSQTEQMSFTATQAGVYTITTRVNEYRNGVLIGYVDRDMQSNVIGFSPSTVATILDATTFTNVATAGGKIFRSNNNLSVSFCFDIKVAVPGTVLVPYDNHSLVCPGSSVTYTNLNSDSVRGCFSWTPASSDSGIRMFTVVVKDSTCAAPGIPAYWSYTYPISLGTPPASIKDNTTKKAETSVYPNPAQQQLQIKTPVHYTRAFVSNSFGQLLLQQEIDKTRIIDISTLPKGLYYLRLEGKNQETETLKFSKE